MATTRRDDGWADWWQDGKSMQLKVNEGKDDPKPDYE